MHDLIAINGLESTVITTTDEGRAKRDELLGMAAFIADVRNATEAEEAARVLTSIKTMTRAVEDSRKAVKAPVLSLGGQIDALAKELTSQLETEAGRIAGRLGFWQKEQRRIEEEAKRRAWEEAQRIQREAEEVARIAAEKARQEIDALRAKEDKARSAQKAEEYAARARLAEERAAKEEHERYVATNKAAVAVMEQASAVAVAKPAGISTREEIKFEVTDIKALYEAAPYLVTLAPNTTAIKTAIKNLTPGELLPGVRHWREAKATVR